MRQHRLVIREPRVERVFYGHASAGWAAVHTLDAAVEPRADERLAREVAAPEERGHGGVGEWLRVRGGEVEDRAREGGAGETVLRRASDSGVGRTEVSYLGYKWEREL
jgi:hypothetical protein